MNILIVNPVLKVGDMVKYRVPIHAGESEARFVVTESNGDRGFMRLICELPIQPVELYHACDVVEA